MLLVAEEGLADTELIRLREVFDILDEKLREIKALIKNSHDPDSDGICDRGEYFIGLGFAATQQYLVETILFTGLSKKEAFELEPIHSSGATFASLVNAAANWWKHEPEWWNAGEVPKNGERSFELVTSVTDSNSYQLSVVLASFCGENELSFNCIIPYLENWRSNVHKFRKKKSA